MIDALFVDDVGNVLKDVILETCVELEGSSEDVLVLDVMGIDVTKGVVVDTLDVLSVLELLNAIVIKSFSIKNVDFPLARVYCVLAQRKDRHWPVHVHLQNTRLYKRTDQMR